MHIYILNDKGTFITLSDRIIVHETDFTYSDISGCVHLAYAACCRLESYDRNDNFSAPVIDVPVPVWTDWPVCGFRQLTHQVQSELPATTNDHIRSYFVLRMACDNQQAGDIKALKKGQQLLDSLRVQACSMLLQDKYVYFTGIIKAAMKKKVYFQYSCDIFAYF